MKKRFLFSLLFPATIFAKSFLISSIPIPKTYIQDIDPYPCDEACMQEYIDNEMIFSFLSRATSKLENPMLDEVRMTHIALLNLGSTSMISDRLKIALLLPDKIIGRYAASTTNATFSYLLARNHSFELKSYQINTQSYEDIKAALKKIEDDGFYYIIAPLTQEGADVIAELRPTSNIYFPTINKKSAKSENPFLFYGGIDYRAQSDLLLKEAFSPLVIFHDSSILGIEMTNYEEKSFKFTQLIEPVNSVEMGGSLSQTLVEDTSKKVIKYAITNTTTNLEKRLKENEDIKEASFFLNTPIVKSGMVMSQLTLYDALPLNILSTQINYDPLLFSMTQYEDRKNMIIANSITEHNNILIEVNSLLGNDIIYDWINYTTTVGLDYFYYLITNENREFDIEMQNNQMNYKIELLRPSLTKFMHYTPRSE
ncbi:MAG: hypothetical protein RBR59_06335 [Sulfurimonadaceae bacterium]|jgi:hypothetical protein|nr:hypothetical protein [Sulfurimonadaceae bacterium]